MSFFRSWKLVSWRTAVLAAVIIYGLVGFLLVPVIAKKMIVKIAYERTGRVLNVGAVRCNPFTLSLTIRDFSVPDRSGTTLLSFDELYANAEVSSLIRWAATLKELRVENLYLGIRRFPTGGINVLELLDDINERTPPSDGPKERGGLPRILLQHILVTGAALDVEDHARATPLVWKFGPAKFELNDITTIPERKGEHDFLVGLQRGGSIGVTGDVVIEPLGLKGKVEIDRVYLETVWEALRPFFKFNVVEGVVGGSFSYSVSLEEDGPHAVIGDLNFLVEDIAVTAGQSSETVLRVKAITTSNVDIAWPEARVRGSSIVVDGADAFQWIRPDGTASWDALVPKPTQKRTVEIYQEVEKAFPWDISLDRFEIKRAKARVEDRTFPEPLQTSVEDVDLEVTDVATGPGNKWGVTASARLMREGAAKARGFVHTGPMRIEVEASLENLQLANVQPYAERMAPIQVRSGTIQTNGVAKVSAGGVTPAASFVGDLTISDFDLGESVLGTTLLQWKRVEARGINAGAGPVSLAIENIDIHEAGLDVVVSEEGKINFLEVMAAMSAESEKKKDDDETDDTGTTVTTEESAIPPFTVQAITFHGCSGSFIERSLTPVFTLALDPVDGVITAVSSTDTVGAELGIKGSVLSGGLVKIEGEMDVLDPKRLTNLEIDIRQVELPPLSPMSVRYIGHPMERGTANLSFDYQVVRADLVGSNKIVTEGLNLGDKVEGEGKVDLPFKLGVSLLTDKEGRIRLEFPVEGDLNDPHFKLGPAVGSAAIELVAKVVRSPLSLLGKLGGGSGEQDLGIVEFAAGSAELEKTATDRLNILAAGADRRPGLVLLIEGTWDPEADATGLKEIAFEAQLANRQASVGVLESMYRETAPPGAVAALRARNMVVNEATGEKVLDEAAYYRGLRKALIDAQPVNNTEIRALADARAEAIRNFMIETKGIDPTRVRTIESVAVKKSSGDEWVRCRLDIDTAE